MEKSVKWTNWYWKRFPYIYGVIAGLSTMLWNFTGFNEKVRPSVELLVVSCVLAICVQTKPGNSTVWMRDETWKSFKTFLGNIVKFSLTFVMLVLLSVAISLTLQLGPGIWDYYTKR